MADNVRDLNSHKPYRAAAKKYKARGWDNPIPLPEKKKSPPTPGYTGRPNPDQGMGKLVTMEQIEKWFMEPALDRANIGVRLDLVAIENNADGGFDYFDIIGLDVDHHDDDPDDIKNGGQQLIHMESDLGVLPLTWTSSARTNGVAGIRFFRVPLPKTKGGEPIRYSFRGDCGEMGGTDIDVIQHVHRYAVVYPSWHPGGGQYLWYPPGVKPSGPDVLKDIDWGTYGFIRADGGQSRGICEIPLASNLPILPEAWVKFLTRDGIRDTGPTPIDMESSDKVVLDWCVSNFSPSTNMCQKMENALKAQLVKLEKSDTNHNVLTAAHMNLVKNGSVDGHSGWLVAVEQYNEKWLADVLARKKRSEKSAKSEIYRSMYGAMRKIKGMAAEARQAGKKFFMGQDPCEISILGDGGDSGKGNGTVKVPISLTRPPEEYEFTDDGNGEFFLHLYQGCLRFVPSKGKYGTWIYWDGLQWNEDVNNSVVPHLFRLVKARQKEAGARLVADGTASGNQQKIDLGESLVRWAKRSGMVSSSKAALDAAKKYPGVSIPLDAMDEDPFTLAVANGVITFNTKEFRQKLIEDGRPDQPFSFFKLVTEPGKDGYVRGNSDLRDMLLTLNTGVGYYPLVQQRAIADGKTQWLDKSVKTDDGHDGVWKPATTGDAETDKRIMLGYGMFREMLDKFLGEKVLHRATIRWLPKLFGSMLIGRNDAKIATWLHGESNTGKSTFQRLLAASVGDYALWSGPKLFQQKALNPELAQALTKRIVCIGEAGNVKIDAELFKNLTGNEPVSVEIKYSNDILRMIARCSIVAGTNGAPQVENEDKATRNRFLIVPFKHQVSGKENDPNATNRIESICKETMLAWLIEGCGRAIMDGITEYPDDIKMETGHFTTKLNTMSDFVDDCIEFCPPEMWETYGLSNEVISGKKDFGRETDWWVTPEALWDTYRRWAEIHLTKQEAINSNKFGRLITNYDGIKRDETKRKVNGKTTQIYVGIKLKHRVAVKS